MIEFPALASFAGVALVLVLTPGPNMAYLVSRSICQGRVAGMVSLLGVVAGFLVYMLLAAFGITALLFAIPLAYDSLRIAGALYLGWLAWNSLRPNGASPFEARPLPPDSNARLFAMGLLTNMLNPKAALLYLSLLPQFVDPGKGSVLVQSIELGMVQIAISATINFLIICGAGTVAGFLKARPSWARAQRLVMGGVLGAMALRLASEARK